jgi:hypothetical protein
MILDVQQAGGLVGALDALAQLIVNQPWSR